jgi:sulfofructose kinase
VSGSEQREIDVLCVGMAAYDLILTVDHHPRADEKCSASCLQACGGGPAANAAVTVARLGGRSAFAGYLGMDHFGNEHLQELVAEGVSTQWIVRRSHPTPLSVILVKPNGERTVVNYKSGMPDLDYKDIDLRECSPQAILFDGHQPRISLELAAWAKPKGVFTILDAGSVHEGTLNLLPLADYVVASAKFALDFTGEESFGFALSALSKHAPVVVITLGEEGVIWKRGGEEGSIPVYRVSAVDTTGAGDAFHGAFALAVAQGKGFTAALEYASATGALCCTKLGARPAIPNQKELDDFLGSI